MRNVYRGFAYAVAVLVALQGAFIAYGMFGLTDWLQDGGTLDASSIGPESTVEVGGGVGFMLHGMLGTLLVPLVALLFLVVSFFARIPGGVRWALIVSGATMVQYGLAFFGRSLGLPSLGALHGLNALILFGVAVTAGMRVRRATAADRAAAADPVAVG